MSLIVDKEQFIQDFIETLDNEFSTDTDSATDEQVYRALALCVRELLSDEHKKFMARSYAQKAKRVYYMCMEFLMGRSLKTNLYNLGLSDYVEGFLKKEHIKLDNVYEQEPDAGLGNGGLGRLAACYLDGAATEHLPCIGYSILYEYGIFRQQIIDGWQRELVDNWLPGGSVWLKAHPDQAVEIRFDGEIEEQWDHGYHNVLHRNYTSVLAIPYDMYVSGYEGGVSKLRLWAAKSPGMDMDSFNKGDYNQAIRSNSTAELISKILYPNDNHVEGKLLRLRQQYFMAAASVGDIVHKYLAQYGSIDGFADKTAIQLNDTHPTLAILELLRILLDDCGLTWQVSLDYARKIFAYTNHTVMSEALERWGEGLFATTLPRIYQILCELNKTCREELFAAFPGDEGKVDYMSLISNGEVRMANVCVYVSHAVNGVSKLHSEIIKQTVFNDYYLYKPEKFKNVTNGIAYRRWLLQSNPPLTKLLSETIGDGFKKDASKLKALEKFADDKDVLAGIGLAKVANKKAFSNYLLKATGEKVDPLSLFDVQVKRLHEYKRQHLNALGIVARYLEIKNNPNKDFVPRTFIFGAKAAPGYFMAKQIIRFINRLDRHIEGDPQVNNLLKVVYLTDYNVTASERLMPASEVSEQISLAGTEASGTGNMKFMLNGAITLGTMDGANVEICEAAGEQNFVRFGLSTPEVAAFKKTGYSPEPFLAQDELALEALQFIERGFEGETFDELADSLRHHDPFMVMADFADYWRAQKLVDDIYREPQRFNKMALYNIANAGIFSADRAVQDYARDIWDLKSVK